jgi:hypothetical protein
MNAAETAKELVEIITAECEPLDAIARRIIANRILTAIEPWLPEHARQPKPETAEAMTEAEARRFEQETIPFGKHAGKPISEVPLDYLAWLADRNRETWRGLHRYLHSKRVQEELTANQEDGRG